VALEREVYSKLAPYCQRVRLYILAQGMDVCVGLDGRSATSVDRREARRLAISYWGEALLPILRALREEAGTGKLFDGRLRRRTSSSAPCRRKGCWLPVSAEMMPLS
jgi:hypothetical protein